MKHTKGRKALCSTGDRHHEKTHTFCDCCEKEITDERTNWAAVDLTKWIKYGREAWQGRNVDVSVQAALADHSGALDICKYCVIDVIKACDDRPESV